MATLEEFKGIENDMASVRGKVILRSKLTDNYFQVHTDGEVVDSFGDKLRKYLEFAEGVVMLVNTKLVNDGNTKIPFGKIFIAFKVVKLIVGMVIDLIKANRED